jgi:hypothetical protein
MAAAKYFLETGDKGSYYGGLRAKPLTKKVALAIWRKKVTPTNGLHLRRAYHTGQNYW